MLKDQKQQKFTDRKSFLKRQLLFLTRTDLSTSVLCGVLYSERVLCFPVFHELLQAGMMGTLFRVLCDTLASGSTGLGVA